MGPLDTPSLKRCKMHLIAGIGTCFGRVSQISNSLASAVLLPPVVVVVDIVVAVLLFFLVFMVVRSFLGHFRALIIVSNDIVIMKLS